MNKEQVASNSILVFLMVLVCYKQGVEFQKLKKEVDEINKNSDQMKQTLSMVLAKLMNPQMKITGGFSNPCRATNGYMQIQHDNQRVTQLPQNQETHGDNQQITQLPHNQEEHGDNQQITQLPCNQEEHGDSQQITQLPHNQEEHDNNQQITQLPHDQGAYGDDQQISQLSSNQGTHGDDLQITLTLRSCWIPEAEIQKIKDSSCSRKNFAKKLAEALFDQETRANSNVNGRGKRKLNPIIIKYIRSICFQFYPHHGDEEAEWKECIRAIDEGKRRLLRKKGT